jgi:hypothetical protein
MPPQISAGAFAFEAYVVIAGQDRPLRHFADPERGATSEGGAGAKRTLVKNAANGGKEPGVT